MFVLLDPTDDELREFSREKSFGIGTFRNKLIEALVGPVCYFAAGWYFDSALDWRTAIIAYNGAAIVVTVSHFRAREKKLDRMVKEKRAIWYADVLQDGPILFDFDEEGISLSAGWKRDRIPWRKVSSSLETESAIAIDWMIVPKRRLTADRIAQLRHALASDAATRWWKRIPLRKRPSTA